MMRLCAFVFFCILTTSVRAQCLYPEFSVLNDERLCRNSPVRLVNEDIEERNYYWDFCPESFSEEVLNLTTSISGAGSGHGYALIEEDGQWHGFLISRTYDKLFRLDFGPDPANTPLVTDLGNPGGLMDAPEDIEFYKDGEEWFAFIGKGDNTTGQVVKLNFGSNLTSIPTATGYGTFGLGSIRIRDLSIFKQGDDIVLVLLIYNTSSFNRINFGNSLNNSPSSNNVVPIPGASLPRGFDVINTCTALRAHVVSENGTVTQVTFGNDIMGAVLQEAVYTFPSVVQPWKIKTVFSGGNYFAVISNNNRKYTVIDFSDLSLTDTPIELVNYNDVRFVGIDVIKFGGKTLIQGGHGGNLLLSASYEKVCELDVSFSYEATPAPLTYRAETTAVIDLSASNDKNAFFTTSHEFQIIALDAPEMKIASDGMCQQHAVLFSFSSTSPVTSWAWDLGNGLTSLAPSPVTSYPTPGRYTIAVEATGTNSCHTSDQMEIDIYPMPKADFIIPTGLLCTNNALTFPSITPDVYEGNLRYEWSVDDSDVSNARDLTLTFNDTGPKTLRLRTSIPGCADEIIKKTSSIEAGPKIAFSYSGLCEEEVFVFQSEFLDPVNSFYWSLQDGQSSSEPSPEQRFSEAGEYEVSLSATNGIGCKTTETKTIIVHEKPLVDFLVEGPPNACSNFITSFRNNTASLDNSQVSAWQWSFGDSEIEQDGRLNPHHLFTQPGTYPVSLTATTSSGCTATIEKPVTILPSPSSTFTFTPACEDVPVHFTGPDDPDIEMSYWEFGTSYSYEASPIHTFAAPGDYRLYAEFHSANGCISTVEKTVRVPIPLIPDFSVLRNCVGHEAVFENITRGTNAVRNTEWIFSDAVTASGSSATRTYAQEGTETITMRVTTESGCAYETTKMVQILPAPMAAFSASVETGAYPLEVSFTNTSALASRFRWNFMDGPENTSAVKSPDHTFSDPGSFNVTLTAYNAQECEDTFVKTISTVEPAPDADVETITMIENPDGSTRLIVTIHNKGNTILKNLPLTFDFAGNLFLRETASEMIMPGARYNFVLNASIQNTQSPGYLCVSLDLDNDLSPEGNRYCTAVEAHFSVLAYPNPARGSMQIEWIAQDQGKVTISLFDATGRKILNQQIITMPGLNRRMLNLRDTRPGVYLLLIEGGTSKKGQRIVVVD